LTLDHLGIACRDEVEDSKVVFRGWARMALPLKAFSVVEVRKPNVGEAKPAAVTADAVLNTGSAPCCPAKDEEQTQLLDVPQSALLFMRLARACRLGLQCARE
jgi:intron-binding protein aquarius